MADRKVAIRFGTEGKAQVVADLDAIGQAGDAGAKRWAKSYQRASEDVEAAMDRQKRSAEKLALLMPGLNPKKLDSYAGVRDQPGKDAQASASIFAAAYAQMEQRAEALRAAIDPAYAAQQRFDREMVEARALMSAGAITLDDYCAKLRIERGLVDQATAAKVRGTVANGNYKIGMQQLGFQFNDIATQLAMGASTTQVFAAQSSQLFQALGLIAQGAGGAGRGVAQAGQSSDEAGVDVEGLGDKLTGAAASATGMGGRLGAVAAFMTGPWGAAVTIAVSLLAPLVAKLFEGNDALGDAVDALRKHAAEADVGRQAQVLFGKSAEGVAAAIRDGTEATRASIAALRSSAEQANIVAKTNLAREISIRRVTLAEIEQAKVLAGNAQAKNIFANGPGAAGSIVANQYAGRVEQLEKQAADQLKLIGKAEARVGATRIELAKEAAERAVDPMLRIKKSYDDQAAAAQRAAHAAVEAGGQVGGALTRQLAQIERNRAAALKTESDKQNATRETAKQIGREVSSAQAASIARAAGLSVNSVDRTTARQKQLYDAWVGAGRPAGNPVAKPGTSAHERGNALDIQMAAGVTARTIRDAFAAEGVRLTKVFAETGHWHVEWARTAQQRTAASDAAKDTRDLAAANRELDADLAEVTRAFLPAKAAAEDYAATLARIDLLRGAEKLSAVEADTATWNAMRDERARRAADQEKQFTTLFGSDDPLARMREDADAERRQRMDVEEAVAERGRENVRSVADLYRDLMTNGTRSIWDLFKQRGMDALADLLAKWTTGATGGGGGWLGSLVGSLFGGSQSSDIGMVFGSAGFNADGSVGRIGMNATGTEYWSGGQSLVGENGPEIVTMPRGARVSPAAETRRMLAANDRTPAISMPVSINAPGADAAALARVEGELRMLRDELPARAVAAWQDARERRLIR